MRRDLAGIGPSLLLHPCRSGTTLLLLLSTITVVFGCEVDEFTCKNGNCIPIVKVNNTVNDCIDNSDEALDPCKPPSFTCTTGTGKERCLPQGWHLDGATDCKDHSDEAKVIGTDCSTAVDCCFCHEYVPNSECGPNSTCICSSGFYSNTLGTECVRRMVGDACTEDADCYNAFTNSSCVAGGCSCDTAYSPSPTGEVCQRHVVGSSCSSEPDCGLVIDNSKCEESVCQCLSGFYPKDEGRTCIIHCPKGHHPTNQGRNCTIRQLGDMCNTDADCYHAVTGSGCTEDMCTCRNGWDIIEKGTACRSRLETERISAIAMSIIIIVCLLLLLALMIGCLFYHFVPNVKQRADKILNHSA